MNLYEIATNQFVANFYPLKGLERIKDEGGVYMKWKLYFTKRRNSSLEKKKKKKDVKRRNSYYTIKNRIFFHTKERVINYFTMN